MKKRPPTPCVIHIVCISGEIPWEVLLLSLYPHYFPATVAIIVAVVAANRSHLPIPSALSLLTLELCRPYLRHLSLWSSPTSSLERPLQSQLGLMMAAFVAPTESVEASSSPPFCWSHRLLLLADSIFLHWQRNRRH